MPGGSPKGRKMTAPQEPIPEYHPFPELDWVPPEPPPGRRWPWVGFVGLGVAAVLICTVAVATHQPSPAAAAIAATPGAAAGAAAARATPPASGGSPMVPTTPTPAPTPAPAPAASSAATVPAPPVARPAPVPAAVAESFANKIAQGESDSASLAVPGSMAHLYADGVALLFRGDPTLYKTVAAPMPGGGWDIGGGIRLSDFVVTRDGLIQTFSRNGISIDKLVAPGDGTTYTATPTTDRDDWSGRLQVRIHSFRFLDGDLQILVTNENQTTAPGGLTFSTYTVAGQQYPGTCCDAAPPGTTTTGLSEFRNVAGGGGTATATVMVNRASATDAVKVDVPALG